MGNHPWHCSSVMSIPEPGATSLRELDISACLLKRIQNKGGTPKSAWGYSIILPIEWGWMRYMVSIDWSYYTIPGLSVCFPISWRSNFGFNSYNQNWSVNWWDLNISWMDWTSVSCLCLVEMAFLSTLPFVRELWGSIGSGGVRNLAKVAGGWSWTEAVFMVSQLWPQFWMGL